MPSKSLSLWFPDGVGHVARGCAPYRKKDVDFVRGYQVYAEETIWSEPEEPLPVLHARGLPAPGVCRLQGRRAAEEALHQPEQDVLEEAERQLRGVPAGGERRGEACPVHGADPLRWRVTGHPTSGRGAGPASRLPT